MMNTQHDEAAQWFAASRRGVMSLEERAALDAWMRIPANRQAFGDMTSTWDALEAARPKVSRTGTQNTGTQKGSRRRPARAMMLAVACVASLGIGVASYGNDTQFWTTLDWSNR